MNIRPLLTASILLATCMVLAASTLGSEPDPCRNAALQYWKAFAALPEFDDQQNRTLLEALENRTVDRSLEKVIKSGRSALHELRKGAAIDDCCWGVSLEEGPNAVLPHLSKARQIARVACVRALQSLEQGKSSEALEDLDAVLALGRHVARDKIMICLLVDYAIERMAIDALAGGLPSLGADQLEALAKKIEALPPLPSMSDAVGTEKEVHVGWLVQVLSKPDGKERLVEIFGGTSKDADENIRAQSQAALLAAAKELPSVYDRLIEIMALPLDQVDQAEEQLEANPGVEGIAREMAMALIPAVGAARAVEAEHQTRLALLKAAIAVQQDGPDVLKSDAYRDPFGTGPFAYRKTEKGFELRSSFTDRKDQPVVLSVGRP